MTAPPVLETARLRLRAPVAADWPHYRALLTAPRSRFMGGPFDLSGAWGWFCHDCALWPLYGHGALVLEPREGGAPLGSVQINDGALFPEVELGWQLFDGAEGRGYATEAARALRDWAFTVRGLPALVSYIDPGNAASIAVAERLGAAPDPEARPQALGDLVYRHRPG